MRIQHNIMSMNAYRNYNNNTSALSKNLEKLSSGYKINRAGDDAAGLAISEKMRAQITGLTQAQANAKSGINLVQTAEGALQEVHDMLNRMVKLADQSANGTFDNLTDRDNLQKEVAQLKSEINRIADSANFNGIKLLDGSMDAEGVIGGGIQNINFGNVSAYQKAVTKADPSFSVSLDGLGLKAGAAAGTIELNVGSKTIKLSFTGATAGSSVAVNGLKFSGAKTTKEITIGNVKYEAKIAGGNITFAMKNTHTLKDTQTLNPSFKVSLGAAANATVTAGLINGGTQVISVGKLAGAEKMANASFEITKDMLVNGAQIKIGDETYTIDFSSEHTAGAGSKVGVKDLLNDKKELDEKSISEVLSRLTDVAQGNDKFSVGNDGQKHITIQSKTGQGSTTYAAMDTIDEIKAQISASVPTKNGTALTLQIGDTSDGFNRLTVSIQDVHVSALKIEDVNIGTQVGAQNAVDKVKDAINKVSSIRGTLGATQNRLDHTINNLSVMTENIQDAESTVRDTDVAEEMMAYTKNNILVQSAQAMLAQANQVPQGVLQLLQ